MYSDRQDHLIINSIVKKNTRVLDVGCADGTLLKMLKSKEVSLNKHSKRQRFQNVPYGELAHNEFVDGNTHAMLQANWQKIAIFNIALDQNT